MSASRVNNTRRLAVYSRIGAIAKSMLASRHSIKCIVEDGQSVLSSCAAQILENLDIQSHFEFMLNETVGAHHKMYGTNCKTLVAMTSFWEDSALYLLAQGVPAATIVESMLSSLDQCIENLTDCVVSLSVPDTVEDTCLRKDTFCSDPQPVESEDKGRIITQPETVVDTNKVKPTLPRRHVAIDSVSKTESDLRNPKSLGVSASKWEGDLAWYFDEEEEEEVTVVEALISETSQVLSHLQGDILNMKPNVNCDSVEEGLPIMPEYRLEEMCSLKDHVPVEISDTRTKQTIDGASIAACDESDDEFDACFDGIEYANQSSDKQVSPDKKLTYDVAELFVDPSAHNTQLPFSFKESQTVSDSADNFERLLAEKLSEKKKTKSAIQVLNQSRHYKTFEVTVDEINQCDNGGDQDSYHDNGHLSERWKEGVLGGSDDSSVTTSPLKVTNKSSVEYNQASSLAIGKQSQAVDVQTTLRGNSEVFTRATHQSPDHYGCRESIVERDVSTCTGKHCHLLKSVGVGLSHGNDDLMALVIEALTNQGPGKDWCVFSTNQLISCAMEGQGQRGGHLVNGMVVQVPAAMTFIVNEKKTRNFVLLNGDLTPSFKHLGYKQSVKTHAVYDEVIPSGHEWYNRVKRHLLSLAVNGVLVKGQVDSTMYDVCLAEDIIIFDSVPYHHMSVVAECSGCHMISDINNATADHVIRHVNVAGLKDDWLRNVSVTYAQLSFGYNIRSAVLCHPCTPVAFLYKEDFNHCLCRVRNSLQCGKLLQGGGVAELACWKYLKNLSDEASSGYHHTVMECVASGFYSYYQQLVKNGVHGDRDKWEESTDDGCLEGGDVYDDYQSKIECWRSAMNLVCLRLLTDQQIITGLTAVEEVGLDWTML